MEGMQRLGPGVRQLPNLDGWLIAEWPRDGGGLQLQQSDGNLFVYALCDLDPIWIAAAQHYGLGAGAARPAPGPACPARPGRRRKPARD
ncbi:MAG: hypothetical protein ACRDS0_31715 [Pseudonocardiaceae bacterium]